MSSAQSDPTASALLELAVFPTFLHGLDGTLRDANGLAREALGCERDDLVGRPMGDVVDEDTRVRLAPHWTQLCPGGPLATVEGHLRRSDGRLIPTEFRMRALRCERGPAVLTVARDISEQHRARQQLSQQRDDLQLILDAMPAFVFYKDTRNRILRVNSAVAQSLGVRPEDLADTDTAFWYPQEAERYYADDLQVIRSGRPKLGIVEQLDIGAGRKRWISTDKFPQFAADGQVKGIVVICQDITERRRLETELLQSQKLESIGLLAGGVAHDFNNLLTAILGHLELGQAKVPTSSPAREHLEAVRIAAERSAELTRQLLAFARKQVVERHAVDLNGVCREAETLLRRMISEHIEIQVQTLPEPAWVRVDQGQVLQVVMNLALNARDAMPKGGTLRLSLRREDLAHDASAELRTGAYVVLSVSDTGRGLTDETKQHLFEPFFTTKATGKGTGLGLAVCYGIVKQNRGHIQVSSELSAGTRFDIYLPATAAPPPAAVRPEPHRPPAAREETILLAEDDEGLRRLACTVLTDRGYRVLVGANGEEALSLARAHQGPIDLLLTDVVMPCLSGPELAERLHAERPDLRVLFMSGYTQNSKLGLGGALLQKPFAPSDLLERVGQVLAAN